MSLILSSSSVMLGSLLALPATASTKPLPSANSVPAPSVSANPVATAGPIYAARGGSIFELDGNALQDAAIPLPDDWELLYDGGLNTGSLSDAFTGVIEDVSGDLIFKGGKKDIQDIPDWGWKNQGGQPDKDDITNAYAAAYSAPDGDTIIYFGADRFSNVGDAFMGFWFFQDNVSLNADGTFNGSHQLNDILVLVNFPQASNATPEFNVVAWDPVGADIATNLRLVSAGILCGAVPPADVCATTNAETSASPWPYVAKDGTIDAFPFESFFEGGVNLSALGFEGLCFSSFMAETRSSKRFTATLKDFALGAFPLCKISVDKTCAVTDCIPPFNVDFTANVTNEGPAIPAGSVLTVVDDAGTPDDTADDVIIPQTLTEEFLNGDVITVMGNYSTTSFPPFNTVNASIDTGTGVVSADAFGIECTTPNCNADLALTKVCSLALETVGELLVVRVDFEGSIENTGDLPLLVTVTDDKAGVVLGPDFLLDVGAIEPITGSYFPSAANGGTPDPCAAMFDDTFTAVGTSPPGFPVVAPVEKMATANCALCPCQ